MSTKSPATTHAKPRASAPKASKTEARPDARPVRRVVVPIEGTDSEFLTQELAAEWASALGVSAHAVHVSAAPDEANEDLWSYFQKACDRWGVELDTQQLAGTDAAQEILAELDAMDLLVIGTRRLTGRFHVGSVTQAILRDAPCAVQVVRLE